MRKLDETCVYDLSELTSDERIKILENNGFESFFYSDIIAYDESVGWFFSKEHVVTTNAKELFYTLENIQVDCSNETEERIKEMADVYVNNGYTYTNDVDFALRVNDKDFYLQALKDKEVCVYGSDPKYTTITYEKFMELFAEPQHKVKYIAEEPKAYKETSNKLDYELDFNFITQLAERMNANKGKYEPYNWQKMDNVEDLKQALFRHVMEAMKGNYEDDNRLFGHLEAIALNAMFINYQLNKK